MSNILLYGKTYLQGRRFIWDIQIQNLFLSYTSFV